MHGLGQVDRAESTFHAIMYVAGSSFYSYLLFWDWASVGLDLPKTTRRHKGLQSHSKKSPPLAERALDHWTLSLNEILVAGGSETIV